MVRHNQDSSTAVSPVVHSCQCLQNDGGNGTKSSSGITSAPSSRAGGSGVGLSYSHCLHRDPRLVDTVYDSGDIGVRTTPKFTSD